ncbi:MAG: FkbM family methyltransferase [Candidatus Verstraetearchaeota archaeon]|nr:FkbM family methyltransferase [Candidatus Verstraetearchaeota archaeon]
MSSTHDNNITGRRNRFFNLLLNPSPETVRKISLVKKLLKVDVEGAEVEVLKGSAEILKLTDYIVFEASKQTIEGCLRALSEFDVKFIEGSGPGTFNFIATRRN